MLTQELLHQKLHYDSETGIFTRKEAQQKKFIGLIAGTINAKGYIAIRVCGIKYNAHRLAWLYIYGYMPKGMIDHINGNPSDNRLCNLRECSRMENMYNSKLKSNNTSGFKNVFWDKRLKKWKVQVRANKRNNYIGIYDNLDIAIKIAENAIKELHGDYTRYI